MNENQKTHKRTREAIEQLKAQCLSSGKSKKQFAEEHGINYMTLMSWFSKMGKKQSVSRPKKTGFIPVPVAPQSTTPFAEICFSNGKRIVFHQPVSAHYFHLFVK
jgi:transposase-like protein